MPAPDNLSVLSRYLKALENGTFADIADIFTQDIVMEQLPNRIYPQGLRANLSQMADAFAKGRKLLSAQTYEIRKSVLEGDRAAIEVLWTGTLAVSFGTLTAGSRMRCYSAMFFDFHEGKIAAQRNYDCFEPW